MVDSIEYVPIVKWKAGEKTALKNIDLRSQRKVLPLIELVNDEGDTPSLLTKDIKNYWPNTAYIDIHYRPKKFGLYALSNLVEHPDGVDLIPVIHTSTDLIFHKAIKDVALMYHNGIAVRVTINEQDDFDVLSSEIDAILRSVEMPKDQADLIIDFQNITESTPYQEMIKRFINSVNLTKWRRVVVAGGVFPDYLTEFIPDEDNFIERLEWQNWKESRDLFGRSTLYADYTCRHPIYYPAPGSPGSKSLRYTLDDKFQIFRGTLHDKPFKLLVHALNAVTLYSKTYPATATWGDAYIHEKAKLFLELLENDEDPETADLASGNNTDWVAAAVSHHIGVVLDRNLRQKKSS